MRLLIFTESFTFGGLETHIVSEIRQLQKRNYEIYLAVGGVYDPTLINELSISGVLQVGLDGNTGTKELRLIENQLKKYIKNEKINLMHVHPFVSIVPGYLAAASAGIPAICTLHGPASIGGVYGNFFDQVTQTAIKNFSQTVVVSNELKRALAGISIESLMIPNAVDFPKRSKARKSTNSKHWRWIVVARLDELKAEGIYDFVKKIHTHGFSSVDIVGDGPEREGLVRRFENERIGKVNFKGRMDNVSNLYDSYDAVGGMGRVAIEAIASRAPVCLVGYDGVKGMVTCDNWYEYSKNNFSGREAGVLDTESFSRDISAYDLSNLDTLYGKIKVEHDAFLSWWKFDIIARRARPVLKNNDYKSLNRLIYSEQGERAWYIRDD